MLRQGDEVLSQVGEVVIMLIYPKSDDALLAGS